MEELAHMRKVSEEARVQICITKVKLHHKFFKNIKNGICHVISGRKFLELDFIVMHDCN